MSKNFPRMPLARLLYVTRLIRAKADTIQYLRRYALEIVEPREIHIGHGEYDRASVWTSRDGSRLSGWFHNGNKPPLTGYTTGGHVIAEYDYEFYHPSWWQRWYLRFVMDRAEEGNEW